MMRAVSDRDMGRILSWDGCVNVRELGGLPVRNGAHTERGRLIRADHPHRLTVQGVRTLEQSGIKTIIELTTLHLESPEQGDWARPSGTDGLILPVEDFSDAHFRLHYTSTGLWQTPLYFDFALERWPLFYARVINAFADADPGTVLVHCGRGHDRTGLAMICLLSVAGVEPEAIVADYELSDSFMPQDERLALQRALDERSTTSRDVILELLERVDITRHLIASGLDKAVVERARVRLCG